MPDSSEPVNTEHALENRAIFDSLVYTPWREALSELDRRQHDPALDAYLHKTFPHGIPKAMQGKKSAILFRHLATTNYEIHRFMMTADALDELSPLVLEYAEDKFNDRNDGKYFLGKLCFHKGMNKNREPIWETVRLIDFNASNNKPISSLSTPWGQPLVDFHHALFGAAFPHAPHAFSDISEWLRSFGPSAKDYYKPFIALFLRDGILFENFYVDEKELPFTRDVVLPAILEVTEEAGVKPLIVALAPTHIEGDQFWYAHPYHEKAVVDGLLRDGTV